MERKCVHSCKNLCNALEVAEHREREAIREYKKFAADCDYPDVRELLDTLIAERERTVQLLVEKRNMLAIRFDTLDSINESFA